MEKEWRLFIVELLLVDSPHREFDGEGVDQIDPYGNHLAGVFHCLFPTSGSSPLAFLKSFSASSFFPSDAFARPRS